MRLLHRVVAASAAAVAVAGAVVATSDAGEPPPPAPPPMALHLPGADGPVAWNRPLHVVVDHGTLQRVTVTGPSGTDVPGVLSPHHRVWAAGRALVPASVYEVRVAARDLTGRTVDRTGRFTTTDTDQHLHATLTPGDGDVVGVGMPVVVQFDRRIPTAARPAVQARLQVHDSAGLTGSWRWFTAREVHWVPGHYWPAGTRVHVIVDLHRLHLGGDVWGEHAVHDVRYRIGPAHVSVVDVAAHTMTVRSDGVVVRTMQISAGRPKYATHGGVHIVLSKARTVVMDSATVGIPRNSPDGYYEKVHWNVRISTSGEFVHSAPWSVAAQGRRNVSHGCVNASPADARWFYDFSRRGDVVEIVNSPRRPLHGDRGTFDWNG